MITIFQEGRWLVVRFERWQEVLGWAPVRGGRARAKEVAWMQVRDADLPPEVDPVALLHEALAERGIPEAVGMLTGRSVARFEDETSTHPDVSARCIITVGLQNARRVGDPAGPGGVGTINLLCAVSVPLDESARVEVLALAAEARTAALLESGYPSPRSGRPATGTGTDCIVVADPCGPGGARCAGKHTAIGSVVGASVYEATRRAVAAWREQYSR